MKIRWKRASLNSNPLPEVDEGNGWVSYRKSRHFRPDNCNFSQGYLTFLACMKAGYKILPLCQ